MKLLIITQKVDRNDSVLGFMHRWIIEFAKNAEQVTVICLYEGEHDFPHNVKVLSLGKEAGLSRFTYLMRFYKYIWMERRNYDAVFVHMNQIYVILGAPLWRLWGKKTALWYTHSQVSFSLRAAEKCANLIFTASAESFRLASAKVIVTGHGIDTDIFVPSKKTPSQGKILSAGRISPIKKYEGLIEALKILHDRNIFPTLEIAGSPATESDKEYEKKLHVLTEKLDLGESVFFAGKVAHEKMPALLSAADVFVNLSGTGSIDKALLEAMSCSVPVITSNEAFIPLFKKYGLENEGLLCDKNDPDDLAAKLEKRFSKPDPELGRRLRDIVVRDHGLSGLIRRIIVLLQ